MAGTGNAPTVVFGSVMAIKVFLSKANKYNVDRAALKIGKLIHQPLDNLSKTMRVIFRRTICSDVTVRGFTSVTILSGWKSAPVVSMLTTILSTLLHRSCYSYTVPCPLGLPTRGRASNIITRYASSGAPYLPPDYTIDDDDDNNKQYTSNNNNNDMNNKIADDILPTARRRRLTNPAGAHGSRLSRPKYDSDNNLSEDDDDMDDDDDDDVVRSRPAKNKKSTITRPARTSTSFTSSGSSPKVGINGASWMERNSQYLNTVGSKEDTTKATTKSVVSSTSRASVRTSSDTTSTRPIRMPTNSGNSRNKEGNNYKSSSSIDDDSNRSFREDFRGTRVFVQGLPESCSWQSLKDHFRVAGNVVFASVSSAIDPNTGKPKGHGIVQFETTAEARAAIRMMRDHPLEGNTLFVREDVQDGSGEKQLREKTENDMNNNEEEEEDDEEEGSEAQSSDVPKSTVTKGPTPPTKWKCADPEAVAQRMSPETMQLVHKILKARNQARRRRNYEACDAMREELKVQYNVHLDDRLTMWWIGAAPTDVVEQVQSSGRWVDESDKQPTKWRQIPSSKENDACVDPDLVFGLLTQRDIARSEKDYATADALLEQARMAPSESFLTLRIHDESKTWKVWSEEKPFSSSRRHQQKDEFKIEPPPAEQCIALCLEYAPDKVDEIRALLLKFPGREYNILKKLKQRYLNL